jgi:membrane protein implicated in regulation of membrane protease activity
MDLWMRWENLIFLAPLLAGVLYTLLLSVVGLGECAELEADADGDFEAGAEAGGFLGEALSVLGIGKVPLSIVIACVSLLWAILGLSAVVTVLGTRSVARLVSRLLPAVETYHATPFELWGETGTALYSITEQGGTVRLRDRFSNLRDLDCRLAAGEEPIAAGAEVRLEEYDPQRDLYYVRRAG